jgi:hypothetical protein
LIIPTLTVFLTWATSNITGPFLCLPIRRLLPSTHLLPGAPTVPPPYFLPWVPFSFFFYLHLVYTSCLPSTHYPTSFLQYLQLPLLGWNTQVYSKAPFIAQGILTSGIRSFHLLTFLLCGSCIRLTLRCLPVYSILICIQLYPLKFTLLPQTVHLFPTRFPHPIYSCPVSLDV